MVLKNAIVTPFVMFEFLHLPFGLRNAGNMFQRMMDQILGNLPYCFVYNDDILVFSPNFSFSASPRRPGAVQSPWPDDWPGKCEFTVYETEFLGHQLTSSALHHLPKHTFAVKDLPPPSDKPRLHQFLGMINFYRRFLHNAT